MPALSPHGHLVVGGSLDGQWIARERSAFSIAIRARESELIGQGAGIAGSPQYTHETYTLRKIAGAVSVWAMADWSSEDVARMMVSNYRLPPVMETRGENGEWVPATAGPSGAERWPCPSTLDVYGVGPIMGDLAKVREFNNEQVAKLNEAVAKSCAGPDVGCDG